MNLKLLSVCLLLTGLCACATPLKYSADDLLIPVNIPPPHSPMGLLSPQQVAADIAYITYALDRAYAGRDFLPAGEYEKAISRLNEIAGAMMAKDLKERIDQVLTDVPDNHLHARIDGETSEYRKSKTPGGHVGKNFYLGSPQKPWAVEKRKVGKKAVLFISITGFPLHESAVWDGFLDQVEGQLTKVDAAIIDLRGNDGGDDTTGLELAWLFYGESYRYPFAFEKERQTPETQALYRRLSIYMDGVFSAAHTQP